MSWRASLPNVIRRSLRKLATLIVLLAIAVAAVTASPDGRVAGEEPPSLQLGQDVQLPPKPRYPRLDAQLNRMVEQMSYRSAQAIAGEAPIYQAASVAGTIRLSGNLSNVSAFLGWNSATVANVGTDYI
jgi:hypothetical protein